MKHPEQFEEFLACCKTQKIKKIHLAELSLLVNPSAADFGSVLIEFEDCMYFITSKYLADTVEEIDEFCVQRIKSLSEILHEITEDDIYKTLSFEDDDISFVTEMVDKLGYFNGLELKTSNYFLFLAVCCPIIIVKASSNEGLKYFMYSHQFGDEEDSYEENYAVLFPEG